MLAREPGRVSITTGWPSRSPRFAATARGEMSVEPAGGNGTISLMGLVGYDCAGASVAQAKVARASAARRTWRRMGISLRQRGITGPVYRKPFQETVGAARFCV